MSEQINVEHAFDPEARKSQADFDNYIDSRPTMDGIADELGQVHPQETNPNSYFDAQREAAYEASGEKSYDELSITEVAKKLAQAEFTNDKTKVEDLSDVLADKMAAEETKIQSTRDAEHNDTRSEQLWNRVMAVKEREIAKLSGESTADQPKQDSLTIATPNKVQLTGEELEQKATELEAKNQRLINDAMYIKFHGKDVGDLGAKLAEIENGLNEMADLNGLTGDAKEAYIAEQVAKIDANDLDALRGTQPKVVNYEVKTPTTKELTRKEEVKHASAEIQGLMHANAEMEARRRKSDDEELNRELVAKMTANDERIKQILAESIITDDPDGAKLEKAIEGIEQSENQRVKEILSKKASKKETVTTFDPAEARTYWEENLRDSGISLEAYAESEQGWEIEREVDDSIDGDDSPQHEEPEEVPTTPPTPPEVVPAFVPEKVQPQKPERKKAKKWGRMALAALSLLPVGGYIAGRVHENKIVKSHDTPTVDAANKFQDHTRDVDTATQERMVGNYETTKSFLNAETGIGTEIGKANFDTMQKQIDAEVAKLKAQHGSAVTDERIQELAELHVGARLTAVAIHEAEAAAAAATAAEAAKNS